MENIENQNLGIVKSIGKNYQKIKYNLLNLLKLTNVKIGKNVVIEKGAILRGDIEIGDNSTIYGHAIIENSKIGKNCQIGGEIKRSILGNHVNSKHQNTTIIDATIDDYCNIGAGVVFANYNGSFKGKFSIGKGSFIGSNSILILKSKPGEIRTIGEYVYIAAGVSVRNDYTNPGDLIYIDNNGKLIIRENGAWKFIQKK